MQIEKKIVGVDIDDTLINGVCWTPEACENATANPKDVERINSLYRNNFVVIYTARRDDLIGATLKFLYKNGVRFHAISNHKIPLDFVVENNSIHLKDILI